MARLGRVLEWFGFDGGGPAGGHGHGYGHGDPGGQGHTHGVIDSSISATERGIWAIKWSFVLLAITAALQLVVVFASGSVALLADTVHNLGDAATAIPLWVAFVLARRKPSRTFAYGLGRAEDLAGVAIVAIILFSAIVAGYQAIDRVIDPQPVTALGWVAAAGVIGFAGNEAVAVFRIRVGRQMNSAALVADGYHARTDGLTSLAVVLGAIGVWLGFPLADPIVGLLITIAIFGIVWQSARVVITRILDGVDPGLTDDIRHAAGHVPGVLRVVDAKARWIGHRLHADVEIAADDGLALAAAKDIARMVERELAGHLPALATANITFQSQDLVRTEPVSPGETPHRHQPPDPFRFTGALAEGVLEIVGTSHGERMRLTLTRGAPGLTAAVVIERPGARPETLWLEAVAGQYHALQSSAAPAEPHAFAAALHLFAGERREVLAFHMEEPKGHRH
jgi:cation diffusion facilitator family transporter